VTFRYDTRHKLLSLNIATSSSTVVEEHVSRHVLVVLNTLNQQPVISCTHVENIRKTLNTPLKLQRLSIWLIK